MSRSLLSVVVPLFNEVEVIPELHRRLTQVLSTLGEEYEIILVDDGSTDGSWERLVTLAADDDHLYLVRLSRNFGHQLAITAGLDTARGDAVVLMDADLQHPPELIPTLVGKWHEGYDVVYAARATSTGETRLKRVTASWFYRLMRRLADLNIPEQAADFRLLSRRAVDALARMPERARFLRGMSIWIGYRQVGVPYQQEPRYAGSTKYPLRKMLKFAADGIVSFSTTPLRLISGLGFATVLFCAAYLIYTLYVRFFTDRAIQGWTSVIVLLLLLGGIQLLSLGIVGQYVARIFEEAKGRPLYLVEETVRGGRTGHWHTVPRVRQEPVEQDETIGARSRS